MKYLLNHLEMKAVDTYSIEHIGIPSLVLMECAALKTAMHLEEYLKKDDKVLAVAGNGNNGADAVAVARILHNKGYQCGVLLAGSEEKSSKELKKQTEIIRNLGIDEYNINDINFDAFDWIVDGVFGIGLARPIEGHYAKLIQGINDSTAKVCAVDIPSGIFAANGQVLGCAVKADITVTFGYDKLGMIFYPGAEYAGRLYVEDIGFAKGALDFVKPRVCAFEKEDIYRYLPKRKNNSNKGTYGKLLVIAGTKNMSGAAFFSAKAAYKTGVGLVKVLTTEENRTIIQGTLPEAVLETYKIGEDISQKWMEKQLQWASAVVIGPGVGQDKHVLDMLKAVLTQKEKPVLIDADGLNVLSEHLDILKAHQCPVVITPHLGEMARLTGKSIAEISENLIETCEAFAKEYHLVCVLKDARSVISDGFENTAVNLSGNNGMSTGGSGDVLAGIIGGLLCQDSLNEENSLWRVAALGAYIHGLSGDAAKKVLGVYGLLASDIIQYIPSVLFFEDESPL